MELLFKHTREDGVPSPPTSVSARLVLACDGTRSSVRELCPAEPTELLVEEGKSCWRGIAPSFDCDATATFYRSDEGTSALLFPAGVDAGSSWTVIAPAAEGRSLTTEQARRRLDAALCRGACDVDASLLAAIDASPTVLEHKLVVRDYDQPWQASLARVAYLGDACHPLRPTGEGTALAWEDAWTLGCLFAASSAADECLRPATLRAYEEARRVRVRAVATAVRQAADNFYDSKATDRTVAGPRSVAKALADHPIALPALDGLL